MSDSITHLRTHSFTQISAIFSVALFIQVELSSAYVLMCDSMQLDEEMIHVSVIVSRRTLFKIPLIFKAAETA